MELVIASANLHKIRELRAILKILKFSDILSLMHFPDYQPVKEEGSTFQVNAKNKAEHAARTLQRWVLADDSGLIVPALSGQPGIYSSRFAGEGATDAENRAKLLSAMKQLQGMQRTAYFECALALASPKGVEKCVSSTCEGSIALEQRGRHGFGYDAIFIKSEYDMTFAEMDEQTKNRISHRSKAVEKLLPALEGLILRPCIKTQQR